MQSNILTNIPDTQQLNTPLDESQQITAIEQELLDRVTEHLEQNQLDLPTAQKLARDFLNVLPVKNRAELLTKLKTLGQTYPEAKVVYTLEFSKDIRQREQEALHQMQHAIRRGNIEHAINVAKKLREN